MPKPEVFGGWLFGFFKLSFPSGRSGEACPKAQAPRPRRGGEHGWREAEAVAAVTHGGEASAGVAAF